MNFDVLDCNCHIGEETDLQGYMEDVPHMVYALLNGYLWRWRRSCWEAEKLMSALNWTPDPMVAMSFHIETGIALWQ